jgi:hypothetical protein
MLDVEFEVVLFVPLVPVRFPPIVPIMTVVPSSILV